MAKTLKIIVKSFFSLFFLFSLIGVIYFYSIYISLTTPIIDALLHPEITTVYASDGQQIKTLGEPDAEDAIFSDLPESFIYALISTEDQKFFIHDGYDIKRLIASAINNISQMEFAEGASTLTQQLIKNKKLNNSKNISRKINELILSYKLEKSLSKEEIFMLYVNQILFDGTKPGINHASQRFFNKSVNQLSLPESALLVALVKSPTIYSPILNPENAYSRKNLVLYRMYQNNYISYHIMQQAQKVQIQDMLNIVENEITYDYQSYLDIVYQEVEELTGLNPYLNPMKIYTNMNIELQKKIDLIQNNNDSNINFIDDLQQVGGVILDNDSNAIIGVVGGRNYQGERIFNRAKDMLQQPASTIKPILSYALAIEHLDWTNEHVVIDEPYFYPQTEIEVRNVDRIHMGELTLVEALGYSRNTVALKTLDQVSSIIGKKGITDYLNSIGLLDVNPNQYNSAYGIGAFIKGVSPLDLANAYKTLANGGVFAKSTTIKEIQLLNENKTFTPIIEENKVLSQETTYKLSRVLKDIVNQNYWGLGVLKIPGIEVFAKSGTSSFDQEFAFNHNYPSNASKDLWIAGYTKNYTCTIWTGFDRFIKDENTYFGSNDSIRKNIPRKLFEYLLSDLTFKNPSIDTPDNLVKVRIIKGYYPYVIADESIKESLVTYSYFDKNNLPNNTLAAPTIPYLMATSVLLIGNQIDISFTPINSNYNLNPNYKTIFSYEKLYGTLGYLVDITLPNGTIVNLKSSGNNLTYTINDVGVYQINAYYGYLDNPSYRSNIVTEQVINYDYFYNIDNID